MFVEVVVVPADLVDKNKEVGFVIVIVIVMSLEQLLDQKMVGSDNHKGTDRDIGFVKAMTLRQTILGMASQEMD